MSAIAKLRVSFRFGARSKSGKDFKATSAIYSLTQSINHSLNRSLNRSLNHSLNHSIAHSITHSLNQSLTHSITHSLNHSLSLTLSLTHSLEITSIHSVNQRNIYQQINPYVRLRPLDGILRDAARLFGGVPQVRPYSGIHAETLHWLPVRQGIFYRFLLMLGAVSLALPLLIFPSFLSFLRPVRVGDRFARPLMVTILIPRSYTATKQNRAFSAAGPSIWSGLPLELRSPT